MGLGSKLRYLAFATTPMTARREIPTAALADLQNAFGAQDLSRPNLQWATKSHRAGKGG